MGAQCGRGDLLIQKLGTKHKPLAIKNLFVPFYYKQLQNCEISAEHFLGPRERVGERCGSMHWKDMTLVLRQETALSPASSNTRHVHTLRRGLLPYSRRSAGLYSAVYFCQGQCSDALGHSFSVVKSERPPDTKWPGALAQGSRVLCPVRTPRTGTGLQLLPRCLLPHSPSACSVAVLQTSTRFLGCCMCFWNCLLQKNELNIILTSSQQWTAGPGWAAVFPASSHFVNLTFVALTLLKNTGNAGLM